MKTQRKIENIPSVYINSDRTDIEFIIDSIGDVTMYTSSEGFDENVEDEKIIEKAEMKRIIDDLTKIYENMEY